LSIHSQIRDFYLSHQVPNPVNITLTEKQLVNGQKIDDFSSEQNFKHFRNLLNSRLFKNAYKRHGKQLSMFVVRECDHTHRHHLHIIMQKPDDIELNFFMYMVKSCWQKTKFGYNEMHFEKPDNLQRIVGWLEYCLKKRTKNDLASSIDWVNSTCFELR
jgi:hypothetical protein